MATRLHDLRSKMLTQSPEHVRALSSAAAAELAKDATIGVLSESDVRHFAPTSTLLQLDCPKETLVLAQLEATLQSISRLWQAGQEEQEADLASLPDQIRARSSQIKAAEDEAERAEERIQLLVQEIHEIHPRLHQRLAHALDTLPPEILRTRVAEDELLAMSIEAALVKVSLLRAHAHEMVYDHSSSRHPGLSMRGAPESAHKKLQAEERELEEEERQLDRELAEYQALLDMVDGGGRGGFKQIVADFARVETETEECRRDLRRLGWTADD